MSNSTRSNQDDTLVPLRRDDVWEIVRHFAAKQSYFTPAMGLEALHDAVSTAFAHVEWPSADRARINDFINALQDFYETVADQDQKGEIFVVEAEDLNDISANLDCLRLVICVQHTELHHHDISSALLWAKTALRRLINNGWNAGFETSCALA